MALHRAPSLGYATDRLSTMKNLENKIKYYRLQSVTGTHIIGQTVV